MLHKIYNNLLLWSFAWLPVAYGRPSLTRINDTVTEVSNGDTFSMRINSEGYSFSMLWNGRELVGNATGGYSDTGGKTTFNFTTPPEVLEQTQEMIHVIYPSYLADVHYILFSGLSGYYQFVVNQNLGSQGEVRSLYRLDPLQFTWGRTNIKNAPLPSIQDIETGYKVQDETWQRRNGSYVTKYDFSCFVRSLDFHGVYGQGVGAWFIAPGKDYYIGDHLKQELMLHRESSTDDAVLLHMYHGSHYNSEFSNDIPKGNMWGPWLFYVNDGSLDDAAARTKKEEHSWPYAWLHDDKYQSRGAVKGKITLSDGRPASGAAVFLGDENGWETNNQGTNYQYTTYADDHGAFTFEDVRREKDYRLIAWANGGKLADVFGVHNGTMVSFGKRKAVELGNIKWEVPRRSIEWRVGDFDRKTLGFKHGGDPMEHGLSDLCPANLVYAIGASKPSDWCFAQSAQGNWTVIFDEAKVQGRDAVLSISFAGYTSQNGYGLGHDSWTLPEIPPTGLNVSMNQFHVGTIVSENATDGALYRSATTAGGYYARQFTIPSRMFLYDRANRLDLTLTQNHRWRGILWDALKLEWI